MKTDAQKAQQGKGACDEFEIAVASSLGLRAKWPCDDAAQFSQSRQPFRQNFVTLRHKIMSKFADAWPI